MNWWQQRQPREQRALLLAGAVIVATLFWYGLWQPLQQGKARASTRLHNLQQAVAWMQQAEQQVAQLQKKRGSGFKDRGRQSLLTLLDQTARLQGLGEGIRRGERAGDQGVRLWLEGVQFDPLMRWLERVERDYGIVVEEFSAESTGLPGQVNARLRFVDTQATQ